jgi:hypothetical protein
VDVQQTRLDRRLEIIAAVILSVTTILTAWSAFESAKWSGLQSIAFSQAGAMRTESVRFSTLAGQQTGIDVALFTQWAEAIATDDTELADFLRDRFRPEFVTAFEPWLASEPLVNPDASSTPFATEEYQLEAAAEADRLTVAADQRAQDGLDNNQTSDNYVLMTVLFAVVLFFVAVGTRFDAVKVRVALLGLAAVGLSTGIVILSTFPIEI